MNVLEDWFFANRLALNNAKTETITLGLRDIAGPNPFKLKFLGIYFDLSLKFDRRFELLAGRLSKIFFS